VARVITRLNVGGPALHATLLTERLDPERYESRLVTGREDPGEGSYLALRGRPVDGLIVVPDLRPGLGGAREVRALIRLVGLMARMRPHIVHTHTAKAGALGRLAAFLTRVPVSVHTYHGHVFRGYFSPARTRVFLRIERALARRTDRLVAVSETVRAELLDLGVGRPEQFVVVPPGLELGRFLESDRMRGQLRAELGLAPSVPLVGIVARLVPIKAHEVFLRAAARLVRRVPESRFVVAGDGERRKELEGLAGQLGVGDRVHFLGWRPDLERVYADLDLVALTSRNEGLPVALVEAMAAARPVVAMRVGGVPDLVEDGVTGCLVPPGNAERLADAMQGLLGDPERRQVMGAAARKRVVPTYEAQRLVADTDRLYAAVLDAKRAGVKRRAP